jgi:hypothetical protein
MSKITQNPLSPPLSDRTLRDYFAGQVIVGAFLSKAMGSLQSTKERERALARLASDAYALADALLVQRQQPPNGYVE